MIVQLIMQTKRSKTEQKEQPLFFCLDLSASLPATLLSQPLTALNVTNGLFLLFSISRYIKAVGINFTCRFVSLYVSHVHSNFWLGAVILPLPPPTTPQRNVLCVGLNCFWRKDKDRAWLLVSLSACVMGRWDHSRISRNNFRVKSQGDSFTRQFVKNWLNIGGGNCTLWPNRWQF